MAITNFIPEVWSAAILEALRAKLVFPSLCNRDYEGDIREAGDTVHITGYDDVTVRKYVRGQAITSTMPMTRKQPSLKSISPTISPSRSTISTRLRPRRT